MPARSLLVAAALLAVLAGAVYWSEQNKKAEETKGPVNAPPKLIEVAEDQVKQVEIRRREAPPVVLQREGDSWKLTGPEPLRADQDAVKSVASAFTDLKWDQLVEEKGGDLAAFGLTAPAVEVQVTAKDGKSKTLLVGDETPVKGAFYAKLAADPRVFTIASFTKESLDKAASDLRDKRLLTFDGEKLSRVELTSKGTSFEFGKSNQTEWTIVRPGPYRADNFQVEELVRKLKEAKLEVTAPDEAKQTVGAFTAAAPAATVRLTDASGVQQLDVRKNAKENAYYARSTQVEGTYKVANDLGDSLAKSLDEFRNKKVFDFAFSDPGRIGIRDEATTYSFEKSGSDWKSGGKTMDATSVQALIDKLRDLSSIKFASSGFTTPFMDLTITSNEGKRVEKVQVARAEGNRFYAKRENESSLYELDGKAVTELQSAAKDVKPAQKQAAAK